MAQIIGIIVGAVFLALFFLLPRSEWPRAPTWMRVTAAAVALPLAILAAVFLHLVLDDRGNLGGLLLLVLAAGAGLSALKLVAWAWIGRLNPRSMLAAALPKPRDRSRG